MQEAQDTSIPEPFAASSAVRKKIDHSLCSNWAQKVSGDQAR